MTVSAACAAGAVCFALAATLQQYAARARKAVAAILWRGFVPTSPGPARSHGLRPPGVRRRRLTGNGGGR